MHWWHQGPRTVPRVGPSVCPAPVCILSCCPSFTEVTHHPGADRPVKPEFSGLSRRRLEGPDGISRPASAPAPGHRGAQRGVGRWGFPNICESRSGHRHACPHGPQVRDIPSSCFQLFVSSLHAALSFLGAVAFFSPVSGRNAPGGKESHGGLGSIVATAQSQSSWVTPAGPLVQMGK